MQIVSFSFAIFKFDGAPVLLQHGRHLGGIRRRPQRWCPSKSKHIYTPGLHKTLIMYANSKVCNERTKTQLTLSVSACMCVCWTWSPVCVCLCVVCVCVCMFWCISPHLEFKMLLKRTMVLASKVPSTQSKCAKMFENSRSIKLTSPIELVVYKLG